METSSRTTEDELVIQLPDLKLLRVIARSVLLAVGLLSFPWLFHPDFLSNANAAAAVHPKWVDEPFSLPMLIDDLNRQGLFATGCNALFLGDPSSRISFLKKNRIEPVSQFVKPAIGDRSVDFLLIADGLTDSSFRFVDRVVKVGGIVAVRLGSDPSGFFHLPPNYRMVYVRRYGSTVVAIKKMSVANAGEYKGDGESRKMGRWLLSAAGLKTEALDRLEEPFLELPRAEEKKLKKMKFLPDKMGDNSLLAYPRRVFLYVSGVDGIDKKKRSLEWFEREYPKKGGEFEIVELELAEGGVAGIAEWLKNNVREEEFVVMKADAEVVEEMVRGNAVGLVDELFFECNNQWGKLNNKKKNRRAYWECLTLYGRVRDEGVAVHQWWE